LPRQWFHCGRPSVGEESGQFVLRLAEEIGAMQFFSGHSGQSLRLYSFRAAKRAPRRSE